MLKQGVLQLPEGFFPPLESKWTDEEKKRMLVVVGFDLGEGLSIMQTVPELMAENKCIGYSKRYQAAVNIAYPFIDTAMNKEYVIMRVITVLNAASADQEKPSYKVTFAFICDENNEHFKLAGIFTGDTDQGNWANAEVVKGIASALNMPVYTAVTNEEKSEGKAS